MRLMAILMAWKQNIIEIEHRLSNQSRLIIVIGERSCVIAIIDVCFILMRRARAMLLIDSLDG